MARKKKEEKQQEIEAKAAARFFEQEKAEYARRMKLAAETDKAKATKTEDVTAGADESDDGDEKHNGETSTEENKEGDKNS
jgi:hypothetical protein